MKKSKLSLGLVTSFIASMALTACGSDVTKNKTNIVDFTGYDGSNLSVLIDEIYEDYMKSSTGIAKYYDQVMEVLIRNAFQQDKTGSKTEGNGLSGVKKNYNQIVNEAKDNVKGAKQTAKQNAETNGTSYKTEWQSVLKEKNVKDEEELLQYYIYQLEKEEIEDWYFDKHEDELKQEYLGVKGDGTIAESKVSSRFPYHIRHILVKVEDGAKEFARGTIDADKAKLLSSAVQLLAEGNMTFGEVAQKKSEDGSSSSYGDVGIMDNKIESGKLGMVNEFQLGIYAYDAIRKNATNAVIEKGLGLDKKADIKNNKTTREFLEARGIVEIPYSVFKELGDVADLEANAQSGLAVEEGKAAVYPRNILWNTYLNNHSIFVITNGKRAAVDAISAVDVAKLDPTTNAAGYLDGEDPDYKPHQQAGESVADYNTRCEEEKIDYNNLQGDVLTGRPGFMTKATEFTGLDEQVLCDENGNVIIGVRSEFGIHLMVVQKSIFDFTADAEKVRLEDYYTTAIPGDSDYPKYADGSEKETYVNFISSVNKSEYNTRADAVRTAIKGFDKTYDYRLYEHLRDNSGINLENESTKKLLESINDYIAIQREKNANDQTDGLEDVWQTYVELLQTQDYFRHIESANSRLVPEGCKIAFTKTGVADTEYKEGGKCYVK